MYVSMDFSSSMVVKGVVCKKNVAHRRMTSKIEKPRFLILGGALEYQRVSNLLSSFDTLLQQVVIILLIFLVCHLLVKISHMAWPSYLGNGSPKDGSGKDRSTPP